MQMNSYLALPYIALISLLAFLSLFNGGRGIANPVLSKWFPLSVLTLFGGLRYHTGYDWMPYTELFERIPDVWSDGLFNLDLSNIPPMEPGYMALNFCVRLLGLSIDYLFLASAAFNTFSLARLLSSLRCNAALAILVHVGFCLILFYFSTVRQGLAVGMIFLACRELILRRRVYLIILYCGASLTFHVSAFMYFPILLLTYFKVKINVLGFILFIVFIGIPLSYYDVTRILFDFAVQNLGLTFFDKFFIYTKSEHDSSWATIALLMLNLSSIVYVSFQRNSHLDTISRLAIFSAMALILTVLLFSNNSSVWSRMMMFSASIQGFWYANHCTIVERGRATIVAVVCALASVSIYIFTLNRNFDFMLPYQTILNRDYGDVDMHNEFLTLRVYQGDF